MTRSQSLRNKMQVSFVTVSAVSIVVVIAFSLVYFYFAVKRQATENMREKVGIAELIYTDQQSAVETFAANVAANNALEVLLDLDIRNKVSEFAVEAVRSAPQFQVIVYDEAGEVVADAGASSNPLSVDADRLPVAANPFVREALAGRSVVGTEEVDTVDRTYLSITSAQPVNRDGIVGGILVRLLLNENQQIVQDISEELNVDAAIIHSSRAITATQPIGMDANLYLHMITAGGDANQQQIHETIDLWFGGTLAQYRAIFGIDGTPVGVLAIQDSARPFMQTFVNALFINLAILAAMLGLAVVWVYMLSRNIINPINDLLYGVNRITNGDLTHEIITNLSDEIGTLSDAFNTMRVSLNEKISTIQEMNEGLEATVKERTHTIESLLESMKKYLPMQLFDAIVGGERNNDINSHYRKKLTIFFSDVVNFTPTTESMEAEDLSDILNYYLDNMAKIALKWGGTIDKFIGDAVMVFFGDPEFTSDEDHALRAVRMSMEMLEKMNEMRRAWTDRGILQPLHVRIGINTGYCTVGNFGSENRMDYTIIGGAVNMAQRLESSAQPDSILISHETYSLVKNEIECEYVSEVSLKGISRPVRAYRVIGERDATAQLDMVRVNPNGILLKDSLVDPTTLEPEERDELIKSLSIALSYAKGSVRYVYDESGKTWKLVKARKQPDGKGGRPGSSSSDDDTPMGTFPAIGR